jgi:hypothetical protein
MLQGHTFRALLDPSIQQHPIYQLHELFHGITAPAFLFGAGLTFVISTRRRWQEYHRLSPHLLRRVGRMLLVIGLGIALNLPYFSLRKILSEGTDLEYLRLFRFDVLHCIGVGLLVLQALIFFFKGERRFYGLVLVFTTSIILLTPLVWDVDFLAVFPPILAQAFNASNGSPFPLFPFAGFLFAGVVASWEFLRAAEQNKERHFMRRLIWLGPLLVVMGILFDAIPLQLYPTYNYWYTSPNYFAIRAGILLLLAAGFWYAAQTVSNSSNRIVQYCSKSMTVLGQESLFVYVLHLLVIFGSVVNPAVNLQGWYGASLDLGGTTLVMIILVGSMLVLAFGWNTLKTRKPLYHRILQVFAAVVFLSLFLTREY